MHTANRIAVFAAALGIVLAGTVSAPAQEKDVTPIPMIEGIKTLEAGTKAPEFTVKDLGGATYSIADEKGKNAVLLVFWSIFCEPCRFEMPVIQKLYEKYRGKGLDIVSVALDGEPLKGSIEGFVKQEGYTFRVLIDELDAKEQFKIADPYGVAGTPTLFLVDKSGTVALAKAGRLKEEELEKAIQLVLKK